jgi:hypothetical protein
MSNQSTVDKIASKTEFNKKLDKYMIKNQIRTYICDPVSGHRLSKKPIKILETWEEIPNLKKSVSLMVLLRKVALNTETFEPMTAYFEVKLEASILSDEMYKFLFLSVCDSRIFMHAVNGDMTAPLALTGDVEGIQKKFSTPTRISNEKALEMLEAGSPIFESSQNGEYKILI